MREITRRTAVALGLVGLTAFAGVKVKDRVAPLTESLSEKPSLFESDGFQYYTVVDKDPEILPADFHYA